MKNKTTYSYFFYSSFLILVYFLRKPAVALFCNGELDALAAGEGHIGLVSLTDDKHIIQPENTTMNQVLIYFYFFSLTDA